MAHRTESDPTLTSEQALNVGQPVAARSAPPHRRLPKRAPADFMKATSSSAPRSTLTTVFGRLLPPLMHLSAKLLHSFVLIIVDKSLHQHGKFLFAGGDLNELAPDMDGRLI